MHITQLQPESQQDVDDVIIGEGNDLQLVCESQEDALVTMVTSTYRWEHGGKVVLGNELRVDGVTRHVTGEYTCWVTSHDGLRDGKKTVTVTVQCELQVVSHVIGIFMSTSI